MLLRSKETGIDTHSTPECEPQLYFFIGISLDSKSLVARNISQSSLFLLALVCKNNNEFQTSFQVYSLGFICHLSSGICNFS